jgi:hypothetical protein
MNNYTTRHSKEFNHYYSRPGDDLTTMLQLTKSGDYVLSISGKPLQHPKVLEKEAASQ